MHALPALRIARVRGAVVVVVAVGELCLDGAVAVLRAGCPVGERELVAHLGLPVVVEVEVTEVALTIAVAVALTAQIHGIDPLDPERRAVVFAVRDAVAVEIVVARVADAVVVDVLLVGVDDQRAVVDVVRNAVVVAVRARRADRADSFLVLRLVVCTRTREPHEQGSDTHQADGRAVELQTQHMAFLHEMAVILQLLELFRSQRVAMHTSLYTPIP